MSKIINFWYDGKEFKYCFHSYFSFSSIFLAILLFYKLLTFLHSMFLFLFYKEYRLAVILFSLTRFQKWKKTYFANKFTKFVALLEKRILSMSVCYCHWHSNNFLKTRVIFMSCHKQYIIHFQGNEG